MQKSYFIFLKKTVTFIQLLGWCKNSQRSVKEIFEVSKIIL